jgi:3-oxoacyl-[acyl-carrier-protein] synthase-3
VLIVCAEQLSAVADWTDRSTCVLFGDAAGAALCERGDGLKAVRLTAEGDPTHLHGWPSGGNCPFHEHIPEECLLYMNGRRYSNSPSPARSATLATCWPTAI